jgi:phosphohistidine phosphatase
MKHLYIMRHAAASHASSDFDRPLNIEGRKQLEDFCSHTLGLFDSVSHVLCSTSTRTRQTCAGIKDILMPSIQYQFLDSLYHAPAGILLEEVQLLPDTARDILVIAHNPGVSDFLGLCATSVSMTLGTAQVACFEVKADSWAALTFNSCVLQEIR